MHPKAKKSPSSPAQAAALIAACACLSALAAGCALRGLAGTAARAGFILYELGSGPLPLVGEWERYEGGLRVGAPAPELVTVSPRSLPYLAPAAAESGATYRLRVGIAGDTRSGPRRMAIYVPGITAFAAARVDGRSLYAGAGGGSPFLSFQAEGSAVAIELDSPPGGPRLESPGLLYPLLVFGEAAEVERFQARSLVIAVAICASFFILGLVSFFLFLFWRKNLEFLGFFAYMLAAGALFTLRFSAALPFEPALAALASSAAARAAALGLHGSALAFVFWTAYRRGLPGALWALALAAPAALAAASAALPGLRASLAVAAIAYSALASLACAAFLAAKAWKKDAQARWILPAFAVLCASIAAEPFLPPAFTASIYLAPLGALLFGFVCALLLVKKVSDSFETAEALSDYVDSISRTVKSFIPKEFLEHLEKADVIDLRLGDHAKKEMTIFFSDIRAFTELSERLTVEENFAFINSYLSRVVPIIRENGGFVDKYVGDGIMALFPDKTGPDEAIRSAIAMQGKMLEYNGHRAKVGYKPISMGVGIHAGDLMLGVVGVSDRMENTVISDAVNLASRLQAITKAFNIAVAISEQAFKMLEDPGAYKYRFIGKVRVKGKAAPVSVFEILDGIAPELFERKMKANMFFEQGMLSYYQKDFAGSIYYFKRVLDIIPEDGAAGFYLENCMNKAGSGL
ncbi:MAG TPA: adenylate/guanylate cyclase domain-containing protein [Spirochaetia bacterium]|nr:adenylate/guanylate cyclase domain-containing protein [Spirochaetia bacterium]HRZ65660.1 adenylate/guanylate cyclase domain-containing protein [Spirochaetia bacterium]